MAALAACDVLDQHDEPRPPPPYIHVVAANVGVNKAMPANGVIQIAFDRFLSPATVNRQGVGLRDKFGNAPNSPIVDYDPITRTMTLSNPNPGQDFLVVGQSYELVFPIATADGGPFGLRAIDGATMDPVAPILGTTATTIDFPVGPDSANLPTIPPIDFCSDIMALFNAPSQGSPVVGACASSGCHGSKDKLDTAMGLALKTEEGIRHTAIGVEAIETTTAAQSTALPSQATFPVGMPIITPGDPGSSYLLYKLLASSDFIATKTPRSQYTSCNTITGPFDYGPSPNLPTADEAARLSDLIQGRRMPWNDQPLTIDEMERIRAWILQGARVDDCSLCYASMP
jgi:hypothetical protein